MEESQLIRKEYNIGVPNESFSNYVSFFVNNLRLYGDVTIHAKNKLYKRIIKFRKDNKKYSIIMEEKSRNKGRNIINISLRDNSSTRSELSWMLQKVENILKEMFPKMKCLK